MTKAARWQVMRQRLRHRWSSALALWLAVWAVTAAEFWFGYGPFFRPVSALPLDESLSKGAMVGAIIAVLYLLWPWRHS